MGENSHVIHRPKLSTQIRRAHNANPNLRPAQLAEQLDTSPKYVSKILRRARVKKFRTGPDATKRKPTA